MVGLMSNGNGKAKIDWLRKFLPIKMGVPSHDTLGRVFSRLDTAEWTIKKEADSILRVKGNQLNLETALGDAITQAMNMQLP